MTITITQNPTFGQLYIEDNDTGEDIRIPSQNVDSFFEELEESHAGFPYMSLPATRIGPIAERIWSIAQDYEG